MDALVFPSEDALLAALRLKLVPVETALQSVKYMRHPMGTIEAVPSGKISSSQIKALKAAGISISAPSGNLISAGHWLEIIPLEKAPSPALNEVLFAVLTQDGLLSLCGELLRLGCDAQEIQLVNQGDVFALVKARNPSWFVVARALENQNHIRVFRATDKSPDRIFVQMGFRHRCEDHFELKTDELHLVRADAPWRSFGLAPWIALDELLLPVGLNSVERVHSSSSLPPIQVQLRLQRSRVEPAVFFVVPNGLLVVEQLVNSMPEEQLHDILFAVVGDTVLLRPRPSREAIASAWPGVPFSRVAQLPNVFAPQGFAIEPPIRRERLRTWLASNPDEVVWLTAQNPGQITRMAVDESAFRSLAQWVDYRVDMQAEPLAAWIRSATFDFEGFVATDEAAPKKRAPEHTEAPERKPTLSTKKTEPKVTNVKAGASPEKSASFVLPTAQLRGADDAKLAAEEADFLDQNSPADSEARRQGWVRLGELYAQHVNRNRESGMVFAHAVWTATAAQAKPIVERWNELGQFRFEQMADKKFHTAERGRAATAFVLWAASTSDPNAQSKLPALGQFFDAVAEELDVRSLWLARVGLARLSGGDQLGLARARDKILTRLSHGLHLEKDVPRVMRAVGGSANAHSGDRVERVAAQLESVLTTIEETPRKRSAVEAPFAQTKAYVQLVFSWGFARLGRIDRSKQLRDLAVASLDLNEPVHQFLTSAFSVRIQQAIDGVSSMRALPPELQASLQNLEASLRYKVDRLRQFSIILEPQERMDPINSYLRNLQVKGEELSSLKSLSDNEQLRAAIETRMETAGNLSLVEEERVRLMDGLIDFLPQLSESQAVPLTERFIQLAAGLAPANRALVLDDCLKVAGHFSRAPLVRQIVKSLLLVMSELGAEGVAEIGTMLTSGVRNLRRVGLRDEAEELLVKATLILKGDDAKTLQAKLGLASGFAYLGNTVQAQPIIDEAIARITKESGLVGTDRMRLSRSTALALSHAPIDIALPGLLRLLPQLPFSTDSFNTNSHFCLTLVDLADALVLGHVGEDLTLSESTRGFLDEDEFAVRRKIHKDVGATREQEN
jgi:cellulose synthase operon protein C